MRKSKTDSFGREYFPDYSERQGNLHRVQIRISLSGVSFIDLGKRVDSTHPASYSATRRNASLKRYVIFHTYAVVTPDGCWYAPGNMGWFGVQNTSADDERDWDINYHDTFIKPALENDWYLTILDCHI